MRFWIFLLLPCSALAKEICTYHTWDWDTVSKSSVNHREVKKPRRQLDPTELGPIPGCSVCVEDQVEIQLSGLPPFRVCKRFRKPILRAIHRARQAGFPIYSVIGYRVGKSKGPLNERGHRTEFSIHSYGAAIDFNAEGNGHYDFCPRFGPSCKLMHGGEYRPDAPGAITRRSPLYKAMIQEGFYWSGEMDGKQKDFMHFSYTREATSSAVLAR